MTQLTPLKLDDGTVIYIEATEGVAVTPKSTESGEESPITFGNGGTRGLQQRMIQNFEAVEGTIRAYTSHTLNALKKVTDAKIDKVTLGIM